MPFVQISLIEGKSEQVITDIADSVHESLVEHFNIPELDRFQTVCEYKKNNFKFPHTYLDIPHTENMVFIHITAKEGRTTEMKKKLYASIASGIAGKTEISEDDILIVLSENKAENWSFGQGVAQLVE